MTLSIMFSQSNYRRNMPTMNGFPPGFNQDMSMQQMPPSQMCYPLSGSDNYSNYSGASTASGISQMSSIYMNNQRKKTLTDEIIACLNSSIEGLLPAIARQSAECIYQAILPHIEKQNKEIADLQKQIELIEKSMSKTPCLNLQSTPMKNMTSIASSIKDISSRVSNSNLILDNQKHNQSNVNLQIKKLLALKDRMEEVKAFLLNEKNKTKRVNNELNDAFSNIVGIKQILENKVNALTREYQSASSEISNNLSEENKKLQQLESLVNSFYKEISEAEGLKVEKNPPKVNYFKKQKFCF